eukprot:SM000267S09858  [mRNA]  locus=s267:152491:154145:- [translate_table: standard]
MAAAGPPQPPRAVAVVTASSRVGAATIAALARLPSPPLVRACVRSSDKVTAVPTADCVELVVDVDAFDPASHERAFRGVSRALIVAPQLPNRSASQQSPSAGSGCCSAVTLRPGARIHQSDEAVNRLLDGARFHEVQHVVLIGGVFQVYRGGLQEEERFLFHRQWMSSRRHAQSLGLTWTQLECSDFMENSLRHTTSIREADMIYGAGAEGLSAPVALADIGAAAALILASTSREHDNRAYHAVGPDILNPPGIAQTFSRALGRTIVFVDVGIDTAYKMAMEAGLGARWQVSGFFDWLKLYFIPGRLKSIQSDLPRLGIKPLSFQEWVSQRLTDFRVEPSPS